MAQLRLPNRDCGRPWQKCKVKGEKRPPDQPSCWMFRLPGVAQGDKDEEERGGCLEAPKATNLPKVEEGHRA